MSTRAERRRQGRGMTFDPSIYVATLFPPDRVTGRFMTAMVLAVDHGWKINRRIFYQSYMSSPLLAHARNQAVQDFLEGDYEWLVFVDSDMIFMPDAIHRLVDSGVKQECGVIGGLCYSSIDGHYSPTIYRMTGSYDDGMPILRQVGHDQKLPVGACKVDATGTGFMAIKRDVITRIDEKYDQDEYPWFRQIKGNKSPEFGEDISFCVRVRTIGETIMVDTRIGVGHVKPEIQGNVF